LDLGVNGRAPAGQAMRSDEAQTQRLKREFDTDVETCRASGGALQRNRARWTFERQKHTGSLHLGRVPENDILRCVGFWFVFKARQQKHSTAM